MAFSLVPTQYGSNFYGDVYGGFVVEVEPDVVSVAYLEGLVDNGARLRVPLQRASFTVPRGADIDIYLSVFAFDGSQVDVVNSTLEMRIKSRAKGPTVLTVAGVPVPSLRPYVAKFSLLSSATRGLAFSNYLFDVDLMTTASRVITNGVARISL